MLTDSVVTNEDYARRAVELGHTILSSCEHGTQGNYCCYMWQYYDGDLPTDYELPERLAQPVISNG